MNTQVRAATGRNIQNVMVSMWQKTQNPKGAGEIGVRVDIVLNRQVHKGSGEIAKGVASEVAKVGLRVIAKMAKINQKNLYIMKVAHRKGDAPISKKLL